jgi:hypothetical protein
VTASDAARASGTDAYVSGSSSLRQWPKGQAMTRARPTTWSSETVPLNFSVRWKRESAESLRWSPIMKRRPSGTFTRNSNAEGLSPGWM